MDVFIPVSFENPDPYLVELETGGVSAALRGTHVLSPRTLLETSLSATRQQRAELPGDERAESVSPC